MTKYKVFKYGSKRRPYYVVRWWDGPPTASTGERSTRCKRRSDANAWAAKFIAELESPGALLAPNEMTWTSFVEHYKAKKLARMPSAPSYRSALSAFERAVKPARLADATTDAVADFQERLRRQGYPDTTVASYSKHVRAAFKWAASEGLLTLAPAVKAGSTNKMRGRPITEEEFERLFAAAEKILGKRQSVSIKRVMLAAWSIGLRRSEMPRVWWDRTDRIHIIGIDRQTPLIEFPASQHKARREVRLPLLPEAVDLLRSFPRSSRTGQVFMPIENRRGETSSADGIGRLMQAIGKRSKVVTKRVEDTGAVEFATLHDLRRSLGTRLLHDEGLSPFEVTAIMRHSSIKVTEDCYGRVDIPVLSDKLSSVKKTGCTLGCTHDGRPKAPKPVRH